ncbi:hypothetical protein [Ensifer sp. SSB1]|uniref:hypothetical protein n=1 Tax=Ensifer sp. SSB1 TaxID=2795385 RepID=UPI0013B0294A|nr:hypothetical protein [Ensifer sp. SSB1]MBK5571204.1 hypothetical protein [Ensifer sp. SSB1]
MAVEIQSVLEKANFRVLGPAADAATALDLIIHKQTAAILDINPLGGITTIPVAEALSQVGVPFEIYSAAEDEG